MNIILVIALLIMIIGLVGTILPVLPGIPIIFAAILGYGVYTHFTNIGFWFILVMGLLTAVSFLVDYLAGVFGAQKYGATRYGIWGAILGGIAGFFIFPPWGIIIGPMAGAIIGELVKGKQFKNAMEIGWGTLIGMLIGSVLKVFIGLAMIIAFVVKVI